MKSIMQSKPPMLPISGRVTTNVSNINLKLLAERTNRIILVILNDRSTEIAVPTDVKRFNWSNKVDTIVSNHTTKSKML